MIECPKCNAALSGNVINSVELTKCNTCGVPLRVDVFPAKNKKPESGAFGETITNSAEASCYYHQKKKAVTHCSMCGRFLCALCNLDIGNQNLCPVCLETGEKKKKLDILENHRILYDNIALFLALVPFTLIFWFLSLVSAPAALFVAIRYWKAPNSLVHRSKIRFVAAFILAGFQVAGWSMFIYEIAT
jgi:hypothetical protein